MYHCRQLFGVIKGAVDSVLIIVGAFQNTYLFRVLIYTGKEPRLVSVRLRHFVRHTGKELAAPPFKCAGEPTLAFSPVATAFSYQFFHVYTNNLLDTILYKVSVSLF